MIARIAIVFLALSVTSASAQAIYPPPAMFDVGWRADIYERGHEPIINAEIPEFDRPTGFATRWLCVLYARDAAGKMANIVSAYFNDADVAVRWKCGRV